VTAQGEGQILNGAWQVKGYWQSQHSQRDHKTFVTLDGPTESEVECESRGTSDVLG
jgi:hypothetical protein